MLTWMVGLCVSLFPPGWTRLEFSFWQKGLRGRLGQEAWQSPPSLYVLLVFSPLHLLLLFTLKLF